MLRIILITWQGFAGLTSTADDEYKEGTKGDPK